MAGDGASDLGNDRQGQIVAHAFDHRYPAIGHAIGGIPTVFNGYQRINGAVDIWLANWSIWPMSKYRYCMRWPSSTTSYPTKRPKP